MKFLTLLTLLTLMASCSGSKPAQDVSEDPAGLEVADADALLTNSDELLDDSILDEPQDLSVDATVPEEAPPATQEVAEVAEVSQEAMNEQGDIVKESDFVSEEAIPIADADKVEETQMNSELSTFSQAPSEVAQEEAPVKIEEVGAQRSYTVSKNETLMLIAFKIFGDYTRWHELMNQNKELLRGSPSNLRPGMKLTYYHSGEEFVWNPGGNPYLIKWGDTLGGISKEVYGTTSKWRAIWDHNRPVIKNPNKIFVGFTIYYLDGDKGVASP